MCLERVITYIQCNAPSNNVTKVTEITCVTTFVARRCVGGITSQRGLFILGCSPPSRGAQRTVAAPQGPRLPVCAGA